MRILMATQGLGIGGAETHIVELSKELRRLGHSVAVCSNGGVYVAELERAGVRHYMVPMHRRSAWPMAKSLFLLRDIILKERPDVVHAHARIPGFLCGILERTMKFPFVTTAHWVFDAGGALRILSNWGTKTIAVSDDIVDYLMTNYGVKRENITVTINGIDTDKFSPEISGREVRRELGIPEDAPVISHVSRLDDSRALASRKLIDGAPALAEKLPGVVILITGGGDVFDELTKKAEAANAAIGRRCIVMTGPRTDINRMVAAGDIFVGVSRAALEAMSAAKPAVVAGNEGYMGVFTPEKLSAGIEGNFCCRGCGEIEDGRFTDDIVGLMLMPAEEREKLGAYGREVVMERYSVRRMAEDAIRTYKSAIPPRRVVMSGYYGFGNAGDEAILKSVLSLLREAIPDADVTVLSRSPEATKRDYGCRAVQRFDMAKVRGALKSCDVLVSGGGSLLQDATSTRSIWYYLSIIRWAERHGKRVLLLANGIGPVTRPANRRGVRKAVEDADIVTLRDADSLDILRKMGVTREAEVTADPVFLMPQPSGERAEKLLRDAGVAGDFIAVSVRPISKGSFAGRMAEVCDELSRRFGVTAVFIPMQPVRDEEASRETAALMKTPSAVLPGSLTAEEIMGVIGKSRLILSMRLHSLIFAARMATPAVGFSYDPKVESYLRLLGQPCAGEASDIDVEKAVAAAAEILENRDGAAARLEEKRGEVTRLAERNLDAIRRECAL